MNLEIEKQREKDLLRLNHNFDQKMEQYIANLDQLNLQRKLIVNEYKKSILAETNVIKEHEKAMLDKREWVGCFIGGFGLLYLFYMGLISESSSNALFFIGVIPMLIGFFILFLPPGGRYKKDINRKVAKAEYNLRMQLKPLDKEIQKLENCIRSKKSGLI